MVDVFISYPRAERDRAAPMKAKLEAMGLDVFFDLESIDGGATFPDAIDRALRIAKAVLCCWSPLYFERPWCLIESRNAKARDILVPAITDGFDPFKPPADLQGINYYDLTRWRGDETHEDWNRMLRRLGTLVNRQLAPELGKSLFGQTTVGPLPQANADARERAALLESWERAWERFAHKEDVAAVEAFLARLRERAPGSGIEFEVQHYLGRLRSMRIETINIPTHKIRELIGSDGKVIREIVGVSSAKVDISDDGTIKITSPDWKAIETVKKRIMEITAEPEEGAIYTGKVVKVMDFGAFVTFFGKRQGLVHVSQMAKERVNHPSDIVKEGDEVKVKLLGFDDYGKVRLSMKVVDQKTGEDLTKRTP